MLHDLRTDFLTQLAAGILGVLLVASVAGWAIKQRYAPGRPHAVIDNMNVRIAAWWIIAALVGVAAAQGPVGLALLFAAASLQALEEFMPQERPRPVPPWIALVALGFVQYVLAAIDLRAAFVALIPVAACAAFAVRARLGESAKPWLAVPAAALICVYGVSHVPAVAALKVATPVGIAAAPALFLVIVVQASDVLQYIAGKLAGRRRIAPQISPAKTVEGAAGGLAGAAAIGALLAPLTPYAPAGAAAIAFALALSGIAGGLLLSALKRRRGIKDWGEIIPGHGGVLDRIDSLVFSAPLLYHVLR